MFFRVEYIVRGIDVPRGHKLKYRHHGEPFLTLQLVHPTPGSEPQVATNDCLGILETEEQVTPRARDQFESNGKKMKPAVAEAITRALNRTHDFLSRVCSALRWRVGDTTPNAVILTQGLSWSDDGKNWIEVSHVRQNANDAVITPTVLTPELIDSIAEIVQSGKSEPLGHELFHEAWHLRMTHPRSALLMAIAAAEIGIKMFIGRFVPQAGWLIIHTQTPPLAEILTELLPLLPVKAHVKGRGPFVPKSILDDLKKGTRLRNVAAYSGETIKPESLRRVLLAVHELLYILDMYSGYQWAAEHLSHATRKEMSGVADQAKPREAQLVT